jgi:subtilisin family serine protease
MLPRIQLPDLQIEFVYQTLSEVYDWGLTDLNIPEIHKQTLGEGIKVCVIDSGRSDHFEVAQNVADSKNFTDSRTVKDNFGHSTFISGIIAARKNDEGIIGVAPGASLYLAKAIDDGGRGNPAAMVNSVKWAINKGVDIISISAGSFFNFRPLHNIIKTAYRKNIIVLAAAGNSGKRHFDVAFPARYPEVIGVAAYDKRHKAAKFSSRGINVFCAMPGVDIYSTWIGNTFCKSKGTSYACPMLAGVCALVLSQHRKVDKPKTPCETPKQMVEHLRKYSRSLSDLNKKAVGFGTIDLTEMFKET